MGQNIGIFGLGLVGMALAERLMANGYSVTGYDPDQSRRALLQQNGGHAAEPAQVWTSDLVFSAVFDTDQLAVLITAAPVGAGGCLLSFSTCDPDRMVGLEAKARAKAWHLIESPVSGTSKQLAKGQAVFLLAGEQ